MALRDGSVLARKTKGNQLEGRKVGGFAEAGGGDIKPIVVDRSSTHTAGGVVRLLCPPNQLLILIRRWQTQPFRRVHHGVRKQPFDIKDQAEKRRTAA
jgi:hypothetical protein